MSARQFADMFAIAQVTPGPNVILVTLIGYHVAGLAGALAGLVPVSIGLLAAGAILLARVAIITGSRWP
jgi:chromate transporter